MNNEQILTKVYLFSGMDQSELNKIASISKSVIVFQGDSIFQEGNEAHSFYIVKFGTLKIVTSSQESNQDVNITTISVGDHFGELPFFDRERRAASVEALEKTELLEIPFVDLQTLIDSNPIMQVKFYRAVSTHLIKRVRMLTKDLTYAREIRKRFT